LRRRRLQAACRCGRGSSGRRTVRQGPPGPRHDGRSSRGNVGGSAQGGPISAIYPTSSRVPTSYACSARSRPSSTTI
jgi:hypothetical protein